MSRKELLKRAKEWLEMAAVFEIGICPVNNKEVTIERSKQLDDSHKWVIKMDSLLLGRDGFFHRTPLFPGIKKEFIDFTSFESADAAHDFWKKCLIRIK